MEVKKFLYKHSENNDYKEGKKTIVSKNTKEPENISDGKFGSARKIYFNIEGKEIALVQKQPKIGKEFDEEEINHQLKVFNLLKKSGIKTFNTFRTDGHSFYSTPLNSDGLIALSANNPSPLVKNVDGSLEGVNKEISEIKNFEEVLKKIIDFAAKAAKNNLSLSWDCLFFIVKDQDLKNGIVDIDLFVGDFDILSEKDSDSDLVNSNICALKDNFDTFIDSYVYGEDKNKYKKLVNERLRTAIKEDEVFTFGGLKNISDYNSLQDGEIIFGKFNFKDNNTIDQVLYFASINKMRINLTDCPQLIKNQIKEIQGTLMDDSDLFNYPKLESVKGNIYANKANSFKVENLSNIGGDLYMSFTSRFDAKKLKKISGTLYLPMFLEYINISDGLEVGSIKFKNNEVSNILDTKKYIKDNFTSINIL